MPSITIDVNTNKVAAELGACGRIIGSPTTEARELCSRIAELFDRISAGMEPANIIVQGSTSSAAQASGTLTLATASGTVGGVINGVTITVTASGGDTATAAAIAAAINASANALVAGIVSATSAGAVVTVTSLDASKAANSITFAASGTGVTASGTGRLAGGSGNDSPGVTYIRS